MTPTRRSRADLRPGHLLLAAALAAAATLPAAAGELGVSFEVSVKVLRAPGAAEAGDGSGAVCRSDAQTGAASCVPAAAPTQWQWRPMMSSAAVMNVAGAAMSAPAQAAPAAGASGGASSAGTGSSAGAGSRSAAQPVAAEPRSAQDGGANYLELMISW